MFLLICSCINMSNANENKNSGRLISADSPVLLVVCKDTNITYGVTRVDGHNMYGYAYDQNSNDPLYPDIDNKLKINLLLTSNSFASCKNKILFYQ